MQATTAQNLTVVDADDDPDWTLEADDGPFDEALDVDAPMPSVYAEADEPDWHAYGRETAAFVKSLLPELDKGEFVDDRPSVHHYAQLEELRVVDALDPAATDDVDLAVLFALPDESLLFVGKDPTARGRTAPVFGFLIEPFDPVPAPTSAQDALDLLRPADVRDAFAEQREEPDRQGEWWLLPTEKVPLGSTFRPGVRDKPYGPSPLGNHVPREFGLTVSDQEFVAGLRDQVPQLPTSITTPPEAFGWLYRQHRKSPAPEFLPDWDTVRDVAGEVLVRGTLRHRNDEHYVENVGDEWHRALTHDMEVYTADEFDRIVLD